MNLRTSISTALAVLVTLFLFWAMQALVHVEGELKEKGTTPRVDFVRLKRDRTPPEKKREKPQREKPEQPPPPPQMNMAKSMNPDQAIAAIDPMLDSNLALEEATTLSSGGERGVVPLVQVEPQYPARAKQRGIEGWVELSFTVTAAGTVTDAVVTKSQPGTIFNQAALRAIERWKFTPKTEQGVPVATTGIRHRIAFRLDE